jgi:SET domain-containing protein
VADVRERRYREEGLPEGSTYLMALGGDMTVDATRAGTIARFINHSCGCARGRCFCAALGFFVRRAV